MASVVTSLPTYETLRQRLGDVPQERILTLPLPGTATEADLEVQMERTGRLCELVEGVLVEKSVGYTESRLAMFLGRAILNYLDTYPLGMLAGEAGHLRLAAGLVRAPDVSFISWDRVPEEYSSTDQVPGIAPDLAVEILSPSNTTAEMDRKVRDYFEAGTRLIWIVDPRKRLARVYTQPDQFVVLDDQGILEGSEVLPGFQIPLGLWLDSTRLRTRK